MSTNSPNTGSRRTVTFLFPDEEGIGEGLKRSSTVATSSPDIGGDHGKDECKSEIVRDTREDTFHPHTLVTVPEGYTGIKSGTGNEGQQDYELIDITKHSPYMTPAIIGQSTDNVDIPDWFVMSKNEDTAAPSVDLGDWGEDSSETGTANNIEVDPYNHNTLVAVPEGHTWVRSRGDEVTGDEYELVDVTGYLSGAANHRSTVAGTHFDQQDQHIPSANLGIIATSNLNGSSRDAAAIYAKHGSSYDEVYDTSPEDFHPYTSEHIYEEQHGLPLQDLTTNLQGNTAVNNKSLAFLEPIDRLDAALDCIPRCTQICEENQGPNHCELAPISSAGTIDEITTSKTGKNSREI
nr:uncharacterized protein CI109_000613 [Kwoniella shandongensis]KAA5531041.1 hypothetical protein CI109_000613 [Kwoniella shandongensis]